MSTGTADSDFKEVMPGELRIKAMPPAQEAEGNWEAHKQLKIVGATAKKDGEVVEQWVAQRRMGSAYIQALNSKGHPIVFDSEAAATKGSKGLNAGVKLFDDGRVNLASLDDDPADVKKMLRMPVKKAPPVPDSPIATRAEKARKPVAKKAAKASKNITPGAVRNKATKERLLKAGGRRMTINMPAEETGWLDQLVDEGYDTNVTEAVIAAVRLYATSRMGDQ